jgi:hypothetical protein
MKFSAKMIAHPRFRSVAIMFAVVATCASPAGAQVAPGVKIDAEATARIEKASTDPFRWIILHSKPRATATPAAPPTPAPQIAVKPVPKPPRRNTGNSKPEPETTRPADTVAAVPNIQPTTPAAQANTAATATATMSSDDSGVVEGDLIHEVIDFDVLKSSLGNTVEGTNGATTGALNTFSFNSPSPVKAALGFDNKRKLMRVDYDVPETVGQYGGAGFKVNIAGDGKSMGQLVKGNTVNGMMIIEVDSSVKTRLKIFIVGPNENAKGSYPFFRLPVEPGLRTYGLMLADFITPSWDASAPDISQALEKVLGVGVEYSRGDAIGEGDKGTFWVGNIRFSNAKQVVAGK